MTTAFEPDSAKVRAIKLPSCRREFSGSAQSFSPRSFREEGVQKKRSVEKREDDVSGEKKKRGKEEKEGGGENRGNDDVLLVQHQ